MTPTVSYLQQKFAEYNKLIFGNELPPIDIVLTKAKGYVGRVVYTPARLAGLISGKSKRLEISVYRDLPEREVEDTLIHEMIHYYIHHKKLKDTSIHGAIFKKMMMDINLRHGRHITISKRVKREEVYVDNKKKLHYICVSTFRDGHRGITVCAKTRIFDIHRDLKHADVIKSIEWWGSTDPFFNRYPNSQTAKVYQITEAELREHLKDAVPLVCDGRVIKPK